MNNVNLIILYLAFLLKDRESPFIENMVDGRYDRITRRCSTFDEKFNILVILLFFQLVCNKRTTFFNDYVFQEGAPSLEDFLTYTLNYIEERDEIGVHNLNMWILKEFLTSGFKNV